MTILRIYLYIFIYRYLHCLPTIRWWTTISQTTISHDPNLVNESTHFELVTWQRPVSPAKLNSAQGHVALPPSFETAKTVPFGPGDSMYGCFLVIFLSVALGGPWFLGCAPWFCDERFDWDFCFALRYLRMIWNGALIGEINGCEIRIQGIWGTHPKFDVITGRVRTSWDNGSLAPRW